MIMLKNVVRGVAARYLLSCQRNYGLLSRCGTSVDIPNQKTDASRYYDENPVFALTGILLVAEIHNGKEVMQNEKFMEYLGHITATTLHLTQPFLGNRKVLFAEA